MDKHNITTDHIDHNDSPTAFLGVPPASPNASLPTSTSQADHNIQHDHRGTISVLEPQEDQSLWASAFRELQKRNLEAFEEFQKCFHFEDKSIPVDAGFSKACMEHLASKAAERIQEADRSREVLKTKSAKVRKFFEQVIKSMISANDLISAAAAAHPYAAAAWMGISFILPVSILYFIIHARIFKSWST